MAYDGRLLARARDRLDGIRAKNQAEHQRRLSLVYSRIPRISVIDDKFRSHMAQLVRLTIAKDSNIADKLAEIERENLDLQTERAELLVQHGFGMDYLDEIYSCPLCRDSGQLEGKVCSCL